MLIGGAEDAVEPPVREGVIDPRLVFAGIPGDTREGILSALSDRVAAAGFVKDAGQLAARLLDRERLGCTGLGGGIAIPHCKLTDIDRVAIAVASTERPVEFGAADGKPVDLVFLVVSPANAAAAHLQALARISRLLRVPGVIDSLRQASTREGLIAVLREAQAGLPVAQ